MLETKRRLVSAVVSVGILLATLDQFIVNVAFPAIGRGLHSDVAGLSWVLNAYSIVFAALLVPAGRFADRKGLRVGFLLGACIFTLASAACAAAGTLELLVAARVVQAVGAALLVPSSLGLLLAVHPPEQRAGAVRAWSAVIGVSAALGPGVGGLLVTLDWRWIFLVNVPLGAAAIAVGWRLLPSLPTERTPFPDLVGSVLLALSIGALSLALVQAEHWRWTSGRTLGAFAAGLAFAVAFGRRSARHPNPVVELALLRVRTFAIAVAATMIYSAAFASMLLSITLWAEQGWSWSALRFGLALAPGPLLVAVVAPFTGRAVDRIGAGPTAAVGCVIFACGVASWIVLIGATPHYVTSMLPGTVLSGVGVGLALPTLMGAGAAALPPQRFGTGSGILNMARQVGFTLGVAILVAVLANSEARQAFHHGWFATIGLAVLAATAAARMGVPAPADAPVAELAAD